MGILKRLSHPCIAEYVDTVIFSVNRYWLILPYYKGGDLDKLIRSTRDDDCYFPLLKILNFFSQLMSAVAYVHSEKILHRDIKPANIFVTGNDNLVLGDFGVSREVCDGLTRGTGLINRSMSGATDDMSLAGSPFYMAPEWWTQESGGGMETVEEESEEDEDDAGKAADEPTEEGEKSQTDEFEKLQRASKKDSISYHSDVWSCGCVLYELVFLERPFLSTNILTLVRTLTSARFKGVKVLRKFKSVYTDDKKKMKPILRLIEKELLIRDCESRSTARAVLRKECLTEVVELVDRYRDLIEGNERGGRRSMMGAGGAKRDWNELATVEEDDEEDYDEEEEEEEDEEWDEEESEEEEEEEGDWEEDEEEWEEDDEEWEEEEEEEEWNEEHAAEEDGDESLEKTENHEPQIPETEGGNDETVKDQNPLAGEDDDPPTILLDGLNLNGPCDTIDEEKTILGPAVGFVGVRPVTAPAQATAVKLDLDDALVTKKNPFDFTRSSRATSARNRNRAVLRKSLDDLLELPEEDQEVLS